MLFTVNFLCFSQVINIHAITHQRQSNGGEYTLDGAAMNTSGRLKLLSVNNFGIAGVYSKSVTIDDGFLASNSLTQVSNFPYSDLFFFGTFDKSDGTLVQFTNTEIDSLYNWSKRGGKLIICGSAPSGSYNPAVLNSKWGFQIRAAVSGSFIPTSVGLTTDIFNGPFGSIGSASQGGTAQGYFNLLPSNVSILARDANNHPTIIMDCTTLDLIVADVDGYTTLSGAVSSGSTITNDQDKYFANTFAFMDKLQPLPQLTHVSNTLTLNASYNNYNWYLDGLPINGAVNPTYTMSDTGNYYVEVTLNGGCKVKSSIISVDSLVSDTVIKPVLPDTLVMPNIFTPNNDGLNDVLIITAKNITTFNCKIYNRWGILVNELTNINDVWDGNTTGGQQCTAGVYYWIAEYKDTLSTNTTLKGYLQLLR